MKIIELTTFFHPVVGGVENQVEGISNSLISKGHHVKIFTTNKDRNGKVIGKIRWSIYKNTHVFRFPVLFRISKFHLIWIGLLFKLLTEDFDVLHVHGFRKYESYVALLVCRLKKKLVLVTTHNPFFVTSRNTKLEKLVKLHDKTFGKYFSKYFDGFLIILPKEEDILLQNFQIPKSKVHLVENAISDIFFERSNSDTNKLINELIPFDHPAHGRKWDHVVLAACRLNISKGLQTLYLATQQHKQTLFLFIGGDDGYESELRKLYNNSDNVVITGKFITQAKLSEAYQLCEIFVMPSLHEPFGLTPLEALASGTRVIVSPCVHKNIGEKFKEYISVADLPEEWSEKIGELLKSSKPLIGPQVEKIQRFDKLTEKFIKIIASLNPNLVA